MYRHFMRSGSGSLPRTWLAAVVALAACGGGQGAPTDAGPSGPPPGTTQLTFESGPVRPLAVSSDGTRVFVANTPNGSLDILRVTPGGLVPDGTVKVGIDPVAVALRSDGEAWVVNHVSDSVSIVDVAHAPPRVVRTLLVGDEPGDIVFAGGDAFIATAHRGQQRSSPDLMGVPGAGDPQLTTPGVGRADVWVFDASSLGSALGGRPRAIVTLFGDTPRGLAVSPDLRTVYAAVFHSGNQTTPVSAALPCPGFDSDKTCMVSGQTIPGSQLGPPTNHAGVAAPRVGLVVKQDAAGAWRDERTRDWSAVTEFQLPDQDVFAIDAVGLGVQQSFAHVGTTLFNLAVNPVTGKVYVSNTEARNDLRFEGPGTFAKGETLQGHLAESRITVISGAQVLPRHLNKHIDYAVRPAPAGVKDHSLSTPLGLAVSADGATLYVAALGSDRIGVLPTAELEADSFDPVAASAGYIKVSGGGPSGVVLDGHGHLIVATRFDDGVSLIDLASRAERSHVQLASPEPARITTGRRFLYDAQVSSSNGEAACASCHMFGDTDHLAWDLGNPDGDVVETPVTIKLGFGAPGTINGTGDLAGLHPMKGPMATQTLRGLVNHGAMHWRGDRVDGFFGRDTSTGPPYNAELAFKNFIVAFDGLLGDGAPFAPGDMQAFADFALAIVMPPNPVRSLDNTLTDAQQRGRDFFMGCAGLDSETVEPVVCRDGRPTTAGHFSDGAGLSGLGFPCEGCHVLRPEQGFFGSDGEMSFEALPQTVKVPQLRNLYTKVGMFGMPAIPGDNAGNNGNQGAQIRGTGFQHDGSVDTIFRFLQARVFNPGQNGRVGFTGGDPQRRDVEQFLLAFDTDLAPIVGQQVTLDASNAAAVGPRIDLLIARARTPFASKVLGPGATECDLVARGVVGGRAVTFALRGDGMFAPDDGGPAQSDAAVRALAAVDGQQITYTCLPPGWPR